MFSGYEAIKSFCTVDGQKRRRRGRRDRDIKWLEKSAGNWRGFKTHEKENEKRWVMKKRWNVSMIKMSPAREGARGGERQFPVSQVDDDKGSVLSTQSEQSHLANRATIIQDHLRWRSSEESEWVMIKVINFMWKGGGIKRCWSWQFLEIN